VNPTDLNHIGVTFQADGSIATADAAAVDVRWQDTSGKGHLWLTIYPSGTTVTLPTLPADGSAWAPTATDTLTVAQAFVFDVSTMNGWDDFRPQIGRFAKLNIISGAGSIRVSELTLP
jgi:hypothetical protein